MQPKVEARCYAFSSVRLMGTNEDFVKLICSPVETTNDLRSPFTKKFSLTSAFKNNNASVAYWTMGKSPPKAYPKE